MNLDVGTLLEDSLEDYPDALVITDGALNPVRANRAARQLLEVPALPDLAFDGEALARALGGADGARAIVDFLTRALSSTSKGERLDLPSVRGPDAGWWLSLRVVPVRSRDGTARALVVRVREISTQERVEEALVESQHKLRISEAQLRSLLESAPDLVICYNRNIQVLYFNQEANRAYLDTLGVELRPGLCTYDLFPAAHRAYWDRINARVLAGETFTEEFRTRTSNGHVLIYELSYHPMRDGEEVIGFTTFGRNVTVQRRQEEALRQSQKLEGLGVLAGGVAHDFNNLLAVMLGNLGLARRKELGSEAAAGFLNNVEKAVLRGADLTRQMLMYAGRGSANVRPHDLSSIVGEISNLLEVSIPKMISLRLQLGAGLPAVQADQGQLQQVVMNLVSNAAEAIGESEGMIRVVTEVVDVTGEESGSSLPGYQPALGRCVKLEVADTGTGMEPEVLARIFDPFFSTKAEGRGLGLCSLLGILRMHRAGLRIETEPGRGSTFRIYLPIAQEGAPNRAEATPLPAAIQGGLILVADDEPGVLEVTAATLEGLGYEVVRARDGVEAVDAFLARSAQVGMVVLDASMPRMGGVQALARMRAVRPGVAAILCSGYSERDVLEASADASTRFLQKPFTMDELARVVHELACTLEP